MTSLAFLIRLYTHEYPYQKLYFSQIYLNKIIKRAINKINTAIYVLTEDTSSTIIIPDNQTVTMNQEEAITQFQELIKCPSVIKVLNHHMQKTHERYLFLFFNYFAKLSHEEPPIITDEMLMKLLKWVCRVKMIEDFGSHQADYFTGITSFLLGPNNKLEDSLLVIMFFQYLRSRHTPYDNHRIERHMHDTLDSYVVYGHNPLEPDYIQKCCLSKTKIKYLERILTSETRFIPKYTGLSIRSLINLSEKYKELRLYLMSYKMLSIIMEHISEERLTKERSSELINKLVDPNFGPWLCILSYLFDSQFNPAITEPFNDAESNHINSIQVL